MFTRQVNVLYSPSGGETPDQCNSSQAVEKVMVFYLLHGSMEIFGPYFHDQGHNMDANSYKWLLAHRRYEGEARARGI